MTNKEKFLALVSEHDNSVLEQIEWRIENRSWLNRSQAVALKILRTLREKGLNQKELAERLNVSPQQVNKWVKGNENFTFETIAKIEKALNIKLMSISGFETKLESKVQIIEVEYIQRVHYSLSEIRRSPIQIRCIPFKSNKVPLKKYKEAM